MQRGWFQFWRSFSFIRFGVISIDFQQFFHHLLTPRKRCFIKYSLENEFNEFIPMNYYFSWNSPPNICFSFFPSLFFMHRNSSSFCVHTLCKNYDDHWKMFKLVCNMNNEQWVAKSVAVEAWRSQYLTHCAHIWLCMMQIHTLHKWLQNDVSAN